MAICLKSSLGLILFNAVVHQVEVAIKSRLIGIKKKHEKKLFNLRRKNVNVKDSPVFTKQITYTFSSYNLSRDEELTLC